MLSLETWWPMFDCLMLTQKNVNRKLFLWFLCHFGRFSIFCIVWFFLIEFLSVLYFPYFTGNYTFDLTNQANTQSLWWEVIYEFSKRNWIKAILVNFYLGSCSTENIALYLFAVCHCGSVFWLWLTGCRSWKGVCTGIWSKRSKGCG